MCVIEAHNSYCGVGTEFVYLNKNVFSVTTVDHEDCVSSLSRLGLVMGYSQQANEYSSAIKRLVTA